MSSADGYLMSSVITVGNNKCRHLVYKAIIPNQNIVTAISSAQLTGECVDMNIEYNTPISIDDLNEQRNLLLKQKAYYARLFDYSSYSEDSLVASVQLDNIQDKLDELNKALSVADRTNKYTELVFNVDEVEKPIIQRPFDLLKLVFECWRAILIILAFIILIILAITITVAIPVLIYLAVKKIKRRSYDSMVRRAVTPMNVDVFRDKVNPVTKEENSKEV